MEHQEDGREQLSETEGSGDDEPGSDHGEATQKKSKGRPCPRRLFTFSLVNSYGTADIHSLGTDGKLLKLNCKHLLWLCTLGFGGLRVSWKVLCTQHLPHWASIVSSCDPRDRHLSDPWLAAPQRLFQRQDLALTLPATPSLAFLTGFSFQSLMTSEWSTLSLQSHHPSGPLLPVVTLLVTLLRWQHFPGRRRINAAFFCSMGILLKCGPSGGCSWISQAVTWSLWLGSIGKKGHPHGVCVVCWKCMWMMKVPTQGQEGSCKSISCL